MGIVADNSGTETQLAKPTTNVEQPKGDLWICVFAAGLGCAGVFLDALKGASSVPEGRAEELKVSIPPNAVFKAKQSETLTPVVRSPQRVERVLGRKADWQKRA